MSRSLCEHATLVEALFDGRLGPSEQGSTERHLKTCASCAALHRDLIATREALRGAVTPVLPLDHQRARLALLRSAGAPQPPRRRPVWLLAFAAAAAPLIAWAASSLIEQRPVVVAPAVAPSASEPLEAPPAPPPSSADSDRPAASTPDLPPPAPAPSLASSPPSQASSPPAPRSPAARPSSSSAPPPVRPPASATPVASAPSASREFAEAMDALSRGDFGAGAGRLGGFAKAHPGDVRVEEAVYLEAIALERAGRLDEAKAAARRYLDRYPNGAHRAQALRLAGR